MTWRREASEEEACVGGNRQRYETIWRGCGGLSQGARHQSERQVQGLGGDGDGVMGFVWECEVEGSVMGGGVKVEPKKYKRPGIRVDGNHCRSG